MSSENSRDHKAFDPSLTATPKRQTQGPTKRLMVDKYLSKNPAEQSPCPSAEQTPKRQRQSAVMLRATSRGSGGKWKLLTQDRGNQAVPWGSCSGTAWFPRGSETVLYTSHCNSSSNPSSPLPLCPCEILRLPQLLLNLSPHHSIFSLPTVFTKVSWQQSAVGAVSDCSHARERLHASKQAGPSSLGLSPHETLPCPADGSPWPCRHLRWDPPHRTPPAL